MKATLAKPRKKLGATLTGLVVAYYEGGSERHLNKLFTALRPYLVGYSFSKLGVTCPDQQQELVQETLIHILEKLRARQFSHSVDEDGRPNSFLPWACRVHHNLFINELRGAQEPSKPSAAEDPFLLLPAQVLALGGTGGVDFTARQEAATLLARVAEVVATLPPKQRRCFEAYYYQNLNYDQIEQLYGYPKATSRGTVRTALAKLTEWAAGQGLKPSESLYESLPGLHTGDAFADPTGHRNIPRGFYSRGGGQKRHYDKKALDARLAA